MSGPSACSAARIAEPNRLRTRGERRDEFVVDAALHQESRSGDTGLTGGDEGGERRTLGRDAGGSTSSKSSTGVLPPSSAVIRANRDAVAMAADRPASVPPVRVILATSGVVGEPSPPRLPCTGHDVDHTLGQSGTGEDVGKCEGGQWGQFGRLHHHGVSVGEGGGQAARQDEHGVVERG